MGVYFDPTPATNERMSELIKEVKGLSLKVNKIKNTNDLNVIDPNNYFTKNFGEGFSQKSLSVVVEREDSTFNVYWLKVNEAIEYIVEAYKYINSKWYKLCENCVDRNNGYLAFENFIGDGYVFRVTAYNRSGEELAKSDGIVIRTNIAK